MKERPQREALEQLWPEISGWCLAHDLPLYKLLSGKWGIPVDGRKLRIACGEKMMTPAEVARETGTSRDTVMKIMTGARRASPAVLAGFARVLGVETVASLLPEGDIPDVPVQPHAPELRPRAPSRKRGHRCPGCGEVTAYRWCDECRCTGTNSKGQRCGHSAVLCTWHGPRAVSQDVPHAQDSPRER